MRYDMRNENENKNVYNGIGFLGLLQVVFIALKVAKVIDWSWWLVFIPTWIDIGIFLIIVIIAIIIAVIISKR